ncbi:unnamed protein product [Linum trigynum]|uniref:CCHC-type domain-containing protein n=1 Tax=Linum trigynum TaxID=586398 RepID=A0AAV2DKN2_9ROSI
MSLSLEINSSQLYVITPTASCAVFKPQDQDPLTPTTKSSLFTSGRSSIFTTLSSQQRGHFKRRKPKGYREKAFIPSFSRGSSIQFALYPIFFAVNGQFKTWKPPPVLLVSYLHQTRPGLALSSRQPRDIPIYEMGSFPIEPPIGNLQGWKRILRVFSGSDQIKPRGFNLEEIATATYPSTQTLYLTSPLLSQIHQITQTTWILEGFIPCTQPSFPKNSLSSVAAAMEITRMNEQAGKGHLVLNFLPEGAGERGEENSVLIGKWLTDNNISVGKACNAAQNKWGSYGEVTIRREAKNLFIYTFPSVAGRDAVWDSRPWSLSNTLLALLKWDGETKPIEAEFPSITLWIQFHDLPEVLRDEKSIQTVAEFVFPKFHRVDSSRLEAHGWMKFFRVLVEVDLQEPVPIGFEYPLGKKSVWVSINYERVTDLCYFCGKIGHQMYACQTREECRTKGLSTEPSGIYSAALKAGYQSPAATPPASFSHKIRGECSGGPVRLSPDHLGSAAPTALLTAAGEHTPEGQQNFGGDLSLGQRSITDTDIFPHSLSAFQKKACSPRRLEEDLEEVAAAVQFSLDLNVGSGPRGETQVGQGSLGGLPFSNTTGPVGGMGQFYSNLSPLSEQVGQQLSIVQEAQLNYERALGRAEKKRKPVWLLDLEKSPQAEFSPPELTKPLIFNPGLESLPLGDQRRRIGIKKRMLTDFSSELQKTGEHGSSSQASVERLKPPNEE